MPPARIVEAIDVLEDGHFSFPSRRPGPAPKHLSLDRFEEGLDGRVVIAIALAAHRYPEPVLTQELLIIVGAILTSAICMMDAAFGRLPQRDRHVQGPDRQIPLHAVADSPADDTAGMQIQDHREIQPAFSGPYIAYVARPFLIWLVRFEVPVQQVRCNIRRMVAVRRDLVFL